MFGLRKPQFKSKRDVYNRVGLYTCSAFFILGFGLMGVSRFRDLGLITYDQAKQSYYLVAFIGLGAFVYSWHKAFQAFSAIMSDQIDKLPDIPETVICLKCHQPISGDILKELKCPNCGGVVEDLRGFYDRHPEMNLPHE